MTDLNAQDFPTHEQRLEIMETLKKLESGELTLNSPFPGMEIPWTKQEEDALDKALSEAFGYNITHD